jgi:hypothetical protein
MLTRIRKLTSRIWVAVITFVIGVALTILWVFPSVRKEKIPAKLAASNLPQQQQIVIPDGWRQLEFDNKVYIMLPLTCNQRNRSETRADTVKFTRMGNST